MLQILMMVLMLLTAFFLIILILIQRGKGGGLAGAFGGMGGQSAFGTKAGDLFTRITIGVAAFWILLCVVSVKYLSHPTDRLGKTGASAPADDGLPQDKSGDDKGSGASQDTGSEGGSTTGNEPAPSGTEK
jgi:preprotein translocase subunit SecG